MIESKEELITLQDEIDKLKRENVDLYCQCSKYNCEIKNAYQKMVKLQFELKKKDYNELIERLRCYTYWLGKDEPYSRDIHPSICDEAADVIISLLEENAKFQITY